jgi:hypothetical protein
LTSNTQLSVSRYSRVQGLEVGNATEHGIPEATRVWGIEIHAAVGEAALTGDLQHLVIVSQQFQQLQKALAFEGVLSVHATEERGPLVKLGERSTTKPGEAVLKIFTHVS